jgi:hypothetical protein
MQQSLCECLLLYLFARNGMEHTTQLMQANDSLTLPNPPSLPLCPICVTIDGSLYSLCFF